MKFAFGKKEKMRKKKYRKRNTLIPKYTRLHTNKIIESETVFLCAIEVME